MLYPMTATLIRNAITHSGLSDEEYRCQHIPDVSQASFSRYKNGKQQIPIEVALSIGLVRMQIQ